tara:strand:+ start:226 stop:357 length:132 start_codon:yes stop_codon:yes gene_type:complete
MDGVCNSQNLVLAMNLVQVEGLVVVQMPILHQVVGMKEQVVLD